MNPDIPRFQGRRVNAVLVDDPSPVGNPSRVAWDTWNRMPFQRTCEWCHGPAGVRPRLVHYKRTCVWCLEMMDTRLDEDEDEQPTDRDLREMSLEEHHYIVGPRRIVPPLNIS